MYMYNVDYIENSDSLKIKQYIEYENVPILLNITSLYINLPYSTKYDYTYFNPKIDIFKYVPLDKFFLDQFKKEIEKIQWKQSVKDLFYINVLSIMNSLQNNYDNFDKDKNLKNFINCIHYQYCFLNSQHYKIGLKRLDYNNGLFGIFWTVIVDIFKLDFDIYDLSWNAIQIDKPLLELEEIIKKKLHVNKISYNLKDANIAYNISYNYNMPIIKVEEIYNESRRNNTNSRNCLLRNIKIIYI